MPGSEVEGKGELLVKEYKLLVIRWISYSNQMYRIVIIVNNNVLYTRKLLREQILNVLSTKREVDIMWWYDAGIK